MSLLIINIPQQNFMRLKKINLKIPAHLYQTTSLAGATRATRC